MGSLKDLAISHGGREADRDSLIIPALNRIFDLFDNLLWREFRSGFELAFLLTGNHQLHVRSANIDDENLLHARSPFAVVIGVNFSTMAVGRDSASFRV